MVDSGKVPREQKHFGYGNNIAGDHIGDNYYGLDPKSRAMLAKMAKYAPTLAGLLEKAVHDGVMSPDAVEALMFAAQNINEDVADALRLAGRNINEDVAEQLWSAGNNINKKVANEFTNINLELTGRVSELNDAADSLRKIVGQVSAVQGRSIPDRQPGPADTVTGTVSRTAGVVIQPATRSPDKWRTMFGLMCGSSAAGLVAAMILMRSHLGGQAIFVTVVMVVAAVALLVKARR